MIAPETAWSLLTIAWRCGVVAEGEHAADQPFTSARRMASVLVPADDGLRALVRGAPEELLSRATHLWTQKGVQPLEPADRERIAKVAVGCYGELETFRRLSASDTPGAWAAAVAAREIVVSPVTPGAVLPLGVDAGRVAFRELRSLAARLGASEWLTKDGPLVQAIAAMERPIWLERDLKEFLGFDPLRLLVGLFSKSEEP